MSNTLRVTVNAASTRAGQSKNVLRPQSITVDGVVLSRDAIARETQNHPAANSIEAWNDAARALVIRELLLQEARRRQIAATPMIDGEGRRETDDEAAIRQLIDTAVVTPVPSEDDCRRVYEAHHLRLRSSDLSEVRHILIAAPPGDMTARHEARTLAQRLIEQLASDPSRFNELAAIHSQCPSAKTGGSLGQISDGQTVPEFEQALATAPVGIVMPSPVESRYGLHVVLVDRRVPGRQLPFEIARQQVAAWLVARSRHIGIRTFIADLARTSKIEGLGFELVAG